MAHHTPMTTKKKPVRVLGGPHDGSTVYPPPKPKLTITLFHHDQPHTYALQQRRDGPAYVHRAGSQ